MKNLILTLAVLLTASISLAQSPQKFSYQAVVRDAAGALVSNGTIGYQINIHQGTPTGVTVYTESSTAMTNVNGLMTTEIGSSTPISISWGNGPFFMEVEIDITGGTNYSITSTTELLSVPYSLYSETAENVINDNVNDADSDPNNEIQTLSLAGQTLSISNGNSITLPGASGANTLDQAYDEGGAGAGRIITADAGPVTVTGSGTATANQGRLHVTTVGGTVGTPSAAISGVSQTTGSVGFGVTGEITNSDNPGAAVAATSNGTGQAVAGVMTGTGSAGYFEVSNPASAFAAVAGTTNGSGSAIQGNTSGTGRAAEFNNSNAGNNSNEIVYISTNSTGGYALNVENTATAGAGLYHTMRAVGSQSNGVAIIGGNLNASGTAIVGYGNNQAAQSLAGGSGGAFNGLTTGVFSRFNTGGVGQGATIQDAFGAQWVVGAWDGSAYRKISGTGTVNTVVTDVNNNKVMLCAPEAPENLFEDYGEGELINGEAIITLDPTFSKNILVNEKHPLRVFIQLEGDCAGVYVTEKTAQGFKVKELNGGNSTIPFTFHVIGNRANEIRSDGKLIQYAEERFPAAKELEELKTLTESKETTQPTPIQDIIKR